VGRVLLGLWMSDWGGVGMVELLPLAWFVLLAPWVALVLVGLAKR
jgi:hypothetical protein